MAPVPTPQVLWRKPPVLALAALPGTALGRLGEPSAAPPAAWAAAGAAARTLHDAPLPRWPGQSLDTLLASGEVPTTRSVNRQRCACESRHDFRRACRVTSSDRRPARQGNAPTGLPLHSKLFLHFHNGPDRAYADVRFGGDFEPVTASTPKQREVLLEQVKAHVTAELASRQRRRG
ncbi:MAG TPA: hypothetical protein VNF47_05250 [Streptosporangiaceae bacterium]|nr:hypothetical protein [Streptosporangiaceae bacterium]